MHQICLRIYYFCENICLLITRTNILIYSFFGDNFLYDELAIDFYIFCSHENFDLMLYVELLGYRNTIALVYYLQSSTFKDCLIQRISHVTMTLYSAFALKRATTLCFLLYHETWFAPIKSQYPDVDNLSLKILSSLHK